MMPSYLCVLVVRVGLLAALGFAPATPAADQNAPPEVNVHKDGNKLAIDVKLSVPVPPPIAWAVLTDFENMPRFMPNLSSSEAVSEAPNQLRVTQKGTTRWGFLNFDFESVRRISLQPMSRIESTTLSGKISKMKSVCELRDADGNVHVDYHVDAEIDFWLPPVLGTRAIRHDMEEQFAALAAEMLRRHTPAGH